MKISNNCIGALNNDEYTIFTKNFIERLKRLEAKFNNDLKSYSELKKTVKDIGSEEGYKWSGKYSELVALDYWSGFKNINNIQYVVQGNTNDMPDSIAKNIGKRKIDLDLKFTLHTKDVYMDVKSFIPTHIELSDRIIEEVGKVISGSVKYLLEVENLRGGDLNMQKDMEEELKSKKLINELCNCIKLKKTYLTYTCSSGNEYHFRLSYPNKNGDISLVTKDSYEPYLAASKNKYKALKDYNKLLVDESSFIVFVLNPWFNREMFSMKFYEKTFYRSFARRAFIEFKNDNSVFDSEYSNLLIKNISEKITGIIFIEDESVTEESSDIYKTYIYLNPNCTNKKITRSDFQILSWDFPSRKIPSIEDFENDNY